MIETEVKLVAPQGVLDEMAQSPLFAGDRTGERRQRTELLESRYFDTPDHRLLRQGLTLRVRKIADRHCQTLKCRGDHPKARSFAKHEWESTVEGFSPDLGRIPKAELGEDASALVADLQPAALQPVFATRMRRRKVPLKLGESEIEVAFDEGVIEAGQQRMPISELELELKAGDGASLYDFALQLLDSAPLALGAASKAQRGYVLALGTTPPTRKAPPSPLRAGASADDAIALGLNDCLAQILANLAAAEDGRSPEGVHQMRVGLRRLRAMLGVFGKEIPASSFERFDREAERLADALSPARGIDAFLDGLAATHLKARQRKALRKTACALRAEAYATLAPKLKDADTARFLLRLAAWIARRGWRNEIPPDRLTALTAPAEDLAPRLLERLHRKAKKRGAGFRRLSPRGRHKFRIASKKLRYMAQFFAPLYGIEGKSDAKGRTGHRTKRSLKRLAKLLDGLGEDHDAQTAPALLQQIERRTPSPAIRRATAAILRHQAARQPAVLKDLAKRRRRWKKAAAFW